MEEEPAAIMQLEVKGSSGDAKPLAFEMDRTTVLETLEKLKQVEKTVEANM